jgi:hypothetical protein
LKPSTSAPLWRALFTNIYKAMAVPKESINLAAFALAQGAAMGR